VRFFLPPFLPEFPRPGRGQPDGIPLFSSDPDEEQAAGLVGVMQAIVSIFADEGDKIRSVFFLIFLRPFTRMLISAIPRYVNAGKTRIAFLLKPPLYLVVVSNDWGEPESVVRLLFSPFLSFAILPLYASGASSSF
jgi:hypothetical protein